MGKAVHPDLEAAHVQFPEDPRVDPVPRAEVERRSKTTLLLEVGQVEGAADAVDGLDIVRQHDCRMVPLGPEPRKASFVGTGGVKRARRVETREGRDARVTRPGGEFGLPLTTYQPAPSCELKSARDERPEAVV